MEPDEQRAASRDAWESVAAVWEGPHGGWFDAVTLPLSHAMVDAIAPQPGQVVLEVGGGVGETGLLAAELLRPGGLLIETDGAEAMVQAAERRAAERGITTGVEFRTMEIEWLDRPTASVDALLGRFAYMLVLDPEAGLREARRVLRPGGKLAIAVWADPADNPYMAVPSEEVDRALGVTTDWLAPGPFALSRPGAVEGLLQAAGFDDVVVTPVDLTYPAASLDELWDRHLACSPSRRRQLADLPPADVYRVRDAVDARWAPHVRADGSVRAPGRAHVAAASA